MYRYEMPNGAFRVFQLLESAGMKLPLRVTAQGLKPQPTLVWSRDATGNLVHAFAFQ